MIRNVAIDPYMFLIDNEEEIGKNIEFFEKLVKILQKKQLKLFLYQSWYEKLQGMSSCPFPIAADKIRSRELREQVLRLNKQFVYIFASSIIGVEIDSCDGEQKFAVTDDLEKDPEYFELLHVLLSSCYTGIVFEERILTGIKNAGKQINDTFTIQCSCDCHEYLQTYCFSAPCEFEDEKDIAVERLRELMSDNLNLYVESPEVVRADHHNPTQHQDKIKSFKDIEAKSRRVLKILRYFGLYKVILEDFHHSSREAAGTVVVKGIRKGNKCDIIQGELYFNGGMKTSVELFFPENIGNVLRILTDNRFEYEAVLSLKEKYVNG